MLTDDERYEFESAYFWFAQHLQILAACPEEACDMQGYYNVAYETHSENHGGAWLFNLPGCSFTADQKSAILELIEALDSIPAEVLSFTDLKSESLRRMQHPSWIPLRAKAQLILEELGQVTQANAAYWDKLRAK
jgi:hypothetical protein